MRLATFLFFLLVVPTGFNVLEKLSWNPGMPWWKVAEPIWIPVVLLLVWCAMTAILGVFVWLYIRAGK